METTRSFLQILDAQMTTPKPYGWFHLLTLGLTVLFTILLCVRGQHHSPQRIRSIVFGVAATVAVLEIYKQINYTFTLQGDTIVADYQWYAFPWQFCSTPMYIGLLAGRTRQGRFHEALCAYLATYAVFAGLCVMLYPVTIFTSTAAINIQTTFCHGSMIAIGAYLLATGYVKIERRTLYKAIPVFLTCVSLAVLMNEAAYFSGLLTREEFNMFFISRHCAPSLPVYSVVQQILPYPWCLLVYVAAFTAAGGLILAAAAGTRQCIFLRSSARRQVPATTRKAHI